MIGIIPPGLVARSPESYQVAQAEICRNHEDECPVRSNRLSGGLGLGLLRGTCSPERDLESRKHCLSPCDKRATIHSKWAHTYKIRLDDAPRWSGVANLDGYTMHGWSSDGNTGGAMRGQHSGA